MLFRLHTLFRTARPCAPYPLFIILICICAAPSRSPAQIASQDYSVQNFTDENALPQNSITYIESDENGYLWLASQLGLIRYDGRNFLNFTTQNTPVLKYNRMLWMGYGDSGKVYFEDEFHNYFLIDSSVNFRLVSQGRTGQIYVAGKSQGFLTYPCKNYAEDQKNFLRDLDVNPFGIADVFSITTHKGYLSYGDNQNRNVISLVENGKVINKIALPFPADDSRCFFFDSTIYFLRKDGKVSFIKDGRLENDQDFFASHGNYAPGFWQNAQFWFNRTGTFMMSGRDLYNLEKASPTSAFQPKLIFSQVPCKNVTTVYYNRNDGFCAIGSSTDGVYLLRKTQFHSKTIGATPEANDNVYAQLNLAGGNVLTSRGTVIGSSRSFLAPIPSPGPSSLFRDSRGFIWFYHQPTLYKTTQDFKVVKEIGFVRTFPVSFFEERPGTIWMGCMDGFYKIQDDSVINVAGDLREFADNYNSMQCFKPKNDSCFLVGSVHGLYEYSYKTNILARVKGIPDINIRTIYTSSDGHTYLGTYGQGFYRLTDSGVVAFPLDPNLYLTTVHCFLEDTSGFFWVSTNKGLFKMSKKELDDYAEHKTTMIYYEYFDRSSGFNTNEFNGGCTPCALKLDDGAFSFPTLKGLVWFHPDSIRQSFPVYKIAIDKVQIDAGKTVLHAGSDLSPRFYELRFFVSSPYYGNPNNQKIEYRLKGLNDQWALLNGDGQIVYNTLRSGNYVLQLRKKTGFGDNQFEYREYAFRVLPHYFETLWFWLIVAALGAAAVYAFIRIRYNLILKSKKRLEKEVRLRTGEQQQLIKHLEHTILELKKSRQQQHLVTEAQERLISVIIHELKSPIKFHNKIARHLDTQFDSMTMPEIRALAGELKQSIQQIHAFVENFMFWLSVQSEKFRQRKTRIELKPLTEGVAARYNSETLRDVALQPMPADFNPIVHADVQLLEGIITNLLDYVCKNMTGAWPQVSLIATATGYQVHIQSHASSTEHATRIGAFFEGGDIYKIEFHTEFSLKIAYDFARMIDARLYWLSSDDGDLIVVALPG